MEKTEMTTTQMSIDKGFQTRDEYLESLAVKFKFSIVFVTELADAYDESKDFEGLLSALSIYSDVPDVQLDAEENEFLPDPNIDYQHASEALHKIDIECEGNLELDSVHQMAMKSLNEIETEGDKHIHDMVENCIKREAEENSEKK